MSPPHLPKLLEVGELVQEPFSWQVPGTPQWLVVLTLRGAATDATVCRVVPGAVQVSGSEARAVIQLVRHVAAWAFVLGTFGLCVTCELFTSSCLVAWEVAQRSVSHHDECL